jgi:hypothetical protein
MHPERHTDEQRERLIAEGRRASGWVSRCPPHIRGSSRFGAEEGCASPGVAVSDVMTPD